MKKVSKGKYYDSSTEQFEGLVISMVTEKKITMKEISERIGISTGMFSKIIHGKLPLNPIYLGRLRALASGATIEPRLQISQPQSAIPPDIEKQFALLEVRDEMRHKQVMDSLNSLREQIAILANREQGLENSEKKITAILEELRKKAESKAHRV